MREPDRTPAAPGWTMVPVALWLYFGLTAAFAFDAGFFSETRFSMTGIQVAIIIVLMVGLISGSRLCRWLLAIGSVLGAYGLLTVLGELPELADGILIAILLVQAALLCTRAARLYTSHR